MLVHCVGVELGEFFRYIASGPNGCIVPRVRERRLFGADW